MLPFLPNDLLRPNKCQPRTKLVRGTCQWELRCTFLPSDMWSSKYQSSAMCNLLVGKMGYRRGETLPLSNRKHMPRDKWAKWNANKEQLLRKISHPSIATTLPDLHRQALLTNGKRMFEERSFTNIEIQLGLNMLSKTHWWWPRARS